MTEQQHTAPLVETDTRWYVIRVISTKEKKIKEYLEAELPATPWKDTLKQIFLPTEKVYRIHKGKKVMQELNYYPGYMMVEVAGRSIPEDLVDFIKNTQFVIHFLGKENPTPLTRAEVSKMLGKQEAMLQQHSGEEMGMMKDPFIIGETIKIIEGPFNDFNGVIEEVHMDKKKLKVVVKIFGRSTPVDLSFLQVERIV